MADQSIYSEIFFPSAFEASKRVIANGSRFAYYTTAATAYQLLKNQQIWMRHTRVMNDYMEVEHGLECIVKALQSSAGTVFMSAMDECYPGSANEIRQRFDDIAPMIRQYTYVTCVSEHTSDEDKYGRLSMWRAYGGDAGVALILNGGAMLRPSDAIGAYSTPVAYIDECGVADELRKIASNITFDLDRARFWGREGFVNAVIDVFRYAAICTKHPSFKEEREWRLVTTQNVQNSSRLISSIEILGGIPQRVLKFQLVDVPEQGLYGLTPSAFIERVLIGPCDYPETIRAAIQDGLVSSGVDSPEAKIYITGIPLRPNQR